MARILAFWNLFCNLGPALAAGSPESDEDGRMGRSWGLTFQLLGSSSSAPPSCKTLDQLSAFSGVSLRATAPPRHCSFNQVNRQRPRGLCSEPPPTAHVKGEFLRMAPDAPGNAPNVSSASSQRSGERAERRGAPSAQGSAVQRHTETLYRRLLTYPSEGLSAAEGLLALETGGPGVGLGPPSRCVTLDPFLNLAQTQ
ncbi:hypothetical protein TREES_T100014050 [Tupaia chinensis]|uniref:Uncharacterized protein n=1 Tax=Tupaia chinensis TaxID=246437 RepID=L9KL89_TUPCH|nr:hypothetical protein TREES_T100014050 [Tupaia chinensis]